MRDQKLACFSYRKRSARRRVEPIFLVPITFHWAYPRTIVTIVIKIRGISRFLARLLLEKMYIFKTSYGKFNVDNLT